MIRKLATVGRVIGIAALFVGPLSICGVALAAGSSAAQSGTSQSGKDCSTLDKTTKAYRDCISGKSSGGAGGSSGTTGR
jgi:hypothetical protein